MQRENIEEAANLYTHPSSHRQFMLDGTYVAYNIATYICDDGEWLKKYKKNGMQDNKNKINIKIP